VLVSLRLAAQCRCVPINSNVRESMEQPPWASLRRVWQSLPGEARYLPASPAQLDTFEHSYGPVPSEYRVFLLEFGGGVVGSERVDGIEQLSNTHAKYESERHPGGWTMQDAFVIGWDGAGNPMAIDRSGAVVVEHHNFGGVHQLAPSFLAFLTTGLHRAL
jgi:hypothetical protein